MSFSASVRCQAPEAAPGREGLFWHMVGAEKAWWQEPEGAVRSDGCWCPACSPFYGPDGRIVPPTSSVGFPFSVNLEHSSWTAHPELVSVVLDPVALTVLAIAMCSLIISL